MKLEYRKNEPGFLHVVVAVMCELVGIVSLILVNDCDGVSDKMVHAVVARASAHLGLSE